MLKLDPLVNVDTKQHKRVSENTTYYCLVVRWLTVSLNVYGAAVSAHLRVLKEANLITKKTRNK